MDELIQALLMMGWQEDGRTDEKVVRMATVRAPLGNHSKSGGELKKFGGRLRFKRGDWKITVGKQTTCLYRNGMSESYNFKTNDAQSVLTAAQTVVAGDSASLRP